MTYKKILIVKADTNDGDYVHKISSPTEKEIVEIILPVAKVLKQFKEYKNGGHTHSHNFPHGGYCYRPDMGEKNPKELYVDTGLLKSEQLEYFEDEFIPYGENGIHSIKEIKLYEIASEQDLLKE